MIYSYYKVEDLISVSETVTSVLKGELVVAFVVDDNWS